MSESAALPPLDVSVVVPTRNRSVLLAQSLRSVLWQEAVNLEVIVVDEASTDNTPDAVAAFADARIRLIRNDAPTGVAAARNRGAANARGEWLAFLDDDDLWAPTKLMLQLREADTLGRDWAYTGGVIIDAADRILRVQHPMPADATVAALRRYDVIPGGGSNVIMRHATWLRTGPFDTRLRNTEDWELYIRLAQLGPPACVIRPLVARRLHPTNSTLDVEEIVRGTRLIEDMHQIAPDWGVLRRWMAHSCLRAGHRRAALGQFAKAAVAGHPIGVTRDLAAICIEAMRRRVGRPMPGPMPASDAWIAEASVWLDRLRRCDTLTTAPLR